MEPHDPLFTERQGTRYSPKLGRKPTGWKVLLTKVYANKKNLRTLPIPVCSKTYICFSKANYSNEGITIQVLYVPFKHSVMTKKSICLLRC